MLYSAYRSSMERIQDFLILFFFPQTWKSQNILYFVSKRNEGAVYYIIFNPRGMREQYIIFWGTDPFPLLCQWQGAQNKENTSVKKKNHIGTSQVIQWLYCSKQSQASKHHKHRENIKSVQTLSCMHVYKAGWSYWAISGRSCALFTLFLPPCRLGKDKLSW